ncbi:MAG: NAD(+) kinase [Gammaproteobacteria bacterium]
MFRRVGIVSKPLDPAVEKTLNRVIATLNRLDRAVIVDETSAELRPEGSFTVEPAEELSQACDLVISIGGDGTLLQSAGLIYPSEVAIMGINLGRLGFLTDIRPDAVESEIEAVLNGDFISEERTVLGCQLYRDDGIIAAADGLNDVVIQKWNTARLITLDTYVDDKFLHSQRSDGMIVATPTGSTAYALSGGGPILDPSINAVALVPICPHTLTNRPIVVSDRSRIEIHIVTEREDESRLTCDGNSIHDLVPGDRIVVFRREKSVRLVHPKYHDHFATLRAKLDWGRAPC